MFSMHLRPLVFLLEDADVYHNPSSEQGVPSHCGPEVGLSGRRGQVRSTLWGTIHISHQQREIRKIIDSKVPAFVGDTLGPLGSLVNTCGLLVGDL